MFKFFFQRNLERTLQRFTRRQLHPEGLLTLRDHIELSFPGLEDPPETFPEGLVYSAKDAQYHHISTTN
jgi:hypothetical protein